jgi:uncharacterized protein
MWHDLWAALALVLVVEGILPFIKPKRWRDLMTQIGGQSDDTLRFMGLTSMLVGVGLLYAVR